MKNDHPALIAIGSDAPVLQSVSALGKLEGLLLSMRLTQSFRNDSSENMEVVYTFPLAWGAVLLGLDATLGDKRMTGRVMARREARKNYEDAVEQGDAPILVEKSQSGTFSASLGSLMPGETATIELTYAQLLSYEQGRIRLLIPTTIAPRYGDGVQRGGLSPDQEAKPSLMAEHGFSLSVQLCGPISKATIGSPTHPIAQQRDSEIVTVTLQNKAWLDRDFVLLLDNLQGQSFAIAGPDALSGEGHAAVIASYCPELPKAAPYPLRLKILVDCSGSMAGDSIRQARDGLRPLVAQLTPQDHVSYSRFGGETRRVFTAIEGSSRNIKLLKAAIDSTEADLGGTELAEALEDTFSVPMNRADQGDEADVLVITDGEVWDAQGIVDAARRTGHRIYALGVGSAPAESLLREMAETTGGACEFATPNEDMSTAIQRLLAKIRLAQSVQAKIEDTVQPVWNSPVPRRMLSGETVHLFMRLPSSPAQLPMLVLDDIALAQASVATREDDLVSRLVAAREISLTEDIEKAKDLAERYQLVTEHTSLLLVFENTEGAKTNGMPSLHKVSPMLAAGWGGSASAVRESRVMFSIAPPKGAEYQILAAPSVWRTNRSQAAVKTDPLSSGGRDDFEIPAFLRKQGESDPTAITTTSKVRETLRNLAGFGVKKVAATPAQIVTAFNQGAKQAQSFRHAIRAVTDLVLDDWMCKMIVDASKHAGGPLKAWAAYLLWMHESGSSDLELSAEAHALVQGQLQNVAPESLANTRQLYRLE